MLWKEKDLVSTVAKWIQDPLLTLSDQFRFFPVSKAHVSNERTERDKRKVSSQPKSFYGWPQQRERRLIFVSCGQFTKQSTLIKTSLNTHIGKHNNNRKIINFSSSSLLTIYSTHIEEHHLRYCKNILIYSSKLHRIFVYKLFYSVSVNTHINFIHIIVLNIIKIQIQ